ncbi:MAG: preprotein translocase subunit SecE [Planctomycetes bacterium]|nr:preprotein translocase subunit SecE [Planctomycetota bacterium]
MEIYKKGEGKLTRRVAFYSLLALSVWGFKTLAIQLSSFKWANTELLGFEMPYYKLPLTIGVALSIALNVVLGIWLFKLLNGEKVAPTLIETEAELKKVSWPSWEDARQSTVIVLIFVAATAVYLTAVEYALKTIFEVIL